MTSLYSKIGKFKLLALFFAGGLLCSPLQKSRAQLPVQSMLRENGLIRQGERDSISRFIRPASFYLSQQEKLERQSALYMREIGKIWLKETRSSLTSLIQDSIQDAGELQVGFNMDKGGLHDPQSPYNHKNATLATWGIRQVGRVKLAGYFSFNRIWEDSLSNNLSSHVNGRTPYYYFAGKAGKFQRQIYNMGFLLGYDVIKDRLYLGLGLDYLHNSSTGSVDPRPEDNWMLAEFKPGLTYKKGNTLVGLNLIKGYGRDDIDIAYKNKMFQTGNAYPDRDYYLNMGYGSIVKKNELVYDQTADHEGLELNFGRQWVSGLKRHDLSAAISYRKAYTDSRYKPDTLLVFDKLARWSEGTYKGQVQYKMTSNKATSFVELLFNRVKGHDSNTIFGGRNYFATDKQLSLRFLQYRNAKLTKSAVKMSWEWGANAEYSTLDRLDILAAHALQADHLDAGLHGALYMAGRQFSIWKLSLDPGLWYPVSVEASVPATQQNYFTTHVFYPMINYLGTTKIKSRLSVSYTTPKLIRGLYSGFELETSYAKGLGVKTGLGSLDLPSGIDLTEDIYNPAGKASRLSISLAFKLYL